MKGKELPAWRKRFGYPNQDGLRQELGIKSRGTISAWENSDAELPRTVQLALKALEDLPHVRTIFGYEVK
ncbi:hypothetical protein [Tropicibacter sp. S64]|uniref:hypothetical protein n=1 Tax=Tropicibacter sp. S64 TaxID=3415122 RepID=UPI003C7B5837